VGITGEERAARPQTGSRARIFRTLLSSTILGAPVLMAEPQQALAACNVSGTAPVQVNCVSNTTTTNTLFPANAPNDRRYIFNDNISGTIAAGVTVDGFGLDLSTTATGGRITFVNNGTVFNNLPGGPIELFELNGNGGTVNYSGNGSLIDINGNRDALQIHNTGAGAINVGTAATPLTGNFTGRFGMILDTVQGDQNVFLNGGTITSFDGGGIAAFASSGDINVAVAGTNIVRANLLGGHAGGIASSTSSGDILISSSATIGLGGGFAFGRGIDATSTSGNITVNQTGGTINVSDRELVPGLIFPGVGINAMTGGAGNIIITTSATSQITGTGLGAPGVNTTGINATLNAGSTGNISITHGGEINSDGIGIGVTNAGSGTVNYSGNGSVSSRGSDGLSINNTGTGAVNVGSAGAPVTATFSGAGGISIVTGNGGQNVFLNGGTVRVTSPTGGPDISLLSVAGHISATVENTSFVHTLGVVGATGIRAVTSSGNILISSSADMGLDGGIGGVAMSRGIEASSGSGNVTVNQTGGTINIATGGVPGRGISASTGGVGNINITSSTMSEITGSGLFGAGINALVAPGGTGDVSIVHGGAIDVSGLGDFHVGGIRVENFGSGSTTINNIGTITVTGLFGSGIVSSGPASVFNSGTITGAGGSNAIDFRDANDLLTIAPTSVITGNVVARGGIDRFQLGGSGTGSFNVGLIGPAQQYRDFETFNVVSGTWILSGSGTQTWNVVGGTLAGTPTIGGLNVVSGGTVAPGNSIGTINVTGPVSFGPGSIYQVEINAAGQSDLIAATGNTTLTGGTVQVQLLSPPTSFAPQATYTILTAANVGGEFDGITDTSTFLDTSLSYTATDVLLNLTVLPFSSVAQTPNQRAIANALQAGGIGSVLGTAVFNMTDPADARRAFDALSGEVHASVQSVLVNDSVYMRNAVLGRLRGASYAGDDAMAALAVGGPAIAYLAEQEGSPLGYAAKSPLPVKAAPRPAPGPDYAAWAQAYGAWGRFDSDGNAATLDRRFAGFLTGIDRRMGEAWRLGIAAGYTNSEITVKARGSSADVDSVHVAGYFGARFGAWNLRGGAAYSAHSIDTTRAISFPGFFDQTRADYDGSTAQVFGEIGYGTRLGNIALEPFAGLAWVSVHTDGFTETALGPAGLAGSDNRHSLGYSTLGLRAATAVPLANGMVLVPRASAAWQYAFNGVTPDAALSFLSTGVPFTIRGVPIARDSALVEAGLDLAISRNVTIGAAYVGQLGDRVQDHAVKGKAVWQF
jgi:outer membrane autotransporter protein